MRTTVTRPLLAILVLVATPTATTAQIPPPPPPPPPPSPARWAEEFDRPALIVRPSVQDELKVSDRQKARIARLLASHPRPPGGSASLRVEEEVDLPGHPLRRELAAETPKILDKSQKERLAQIELQREGYTALTRSDVAARLKLNASQSRAIKAILSEMRSTVAQAIPIPKTGPMPPPGFDAPKGPPPGGPGMPPDGPPPNPLESETFRSDLANARKVLDRARWLANKQIAEILTDAQKASFEKRLGKPFDLTSLQKDASSRKSATMPENSSGSGRSISAPGSR